MFRRNRLGTTAALLCHLVVGLLLVTSRLLAGQINAADTQPLPRTDSGDQVTIRAREQEKTGDLYKLRGEVEIDFRNLVLHADEATYDAGTGQVTATGNLALDGGPHDEHITASRGEYNVRTQTGKFYDVVGTTGVRFATRRTILTSSNPFAFSGKLVEKTAPDVYVVHQGMVTSCELPRPKWTLNAERIVVDLGGKARAYNSTFRVEKVPLFYLPYADHPVEQLGRQSGFLMPNVGNSNIKGLILGDSFYWAISRSMDATLGAEYFSKRGWAEHGTWRFRPTEDAYLNAHYFGVLDRGFGNPHVNQGGAEVGVDGEAKFPHGFRGVLSADYLSRYIFRLAFGETFTQAVDSEVRSLAFLSRTVDGFGFNFLAGRYQNFQSTAPGQVVTILHVPSFEISSVERRLGPLPVYWSFNTAAEGVSRKEPGFVTDDLVGRYDVHPRASLPVLLRGWSFRPEVGLRETYYSERQLPGLPGQLGQPTGTYINRNAVETSMEIRPPSLERIFDRPVLGRRLKHVIEPRMVYRYVAGIENFAEIIRFDSRDILSDTNELEYGVIQRLYIKAPGQPRCQPAAPAVPLGTAVAPAAPEANANKPGITEYCAGARELVSWEVKQKYFFDPTFGGAVVPGTRNVFTTTDLFTGIAFISGPRRFTPIVSRILVHPSATTDFGWQLDYDTVTSRLNASTVYADYRLGSFFLGGTHTYFREILAPSQPGPDRFNQFRVLLGYGNLVKRGINAAASIGFDSNLSFLQYSAFQSSYNWDCCGLSFEYRRYALGAVRNENQFRFAFTLANIATFGNLRRQERIY